DRVAVVAGVGLVVQGKRVGAAFAVDAQPPLDPVGGTHGDGVVAPARVDGRLGAGTGDVDDVGAAAGVDRQRTQVVAHVVDRGRGQAGDGAVTDRQGPGRAVARVIDVQPGVARGVADAQRPADVLHAAGAADVDHVVPPAGRHGGAAGKA